MRRMFRTILGFLSVLAVGFSPGLAFASTIVSRDFFHPLATSLHLDRTAHSAHVVPLQVVRPTQGANVLTATDCSMTRSFDGVLHNSTSVRNAIIGSVGLAT